MIKQKLFLLATSAALGTLLVSATDIAHAQSPTSDQGLEYSGLPVDPATGPSTLDGMLQADTAQGEQAAPDIRDMAFEAALAAAMPLTPEQIRKLISQMSSLQSAASPALSDPEKPKAVMKVETVSLDPGSAPPVIKLSAGYVTTVMVTDATGAPWAVQDMAFAGNFEVRVSKSSPHILRITPRLRFQEGNLTLQLMDMAAPVTFRLSAQGGGAEVYYRYDVRIPAIGPLASAPPIEGGNRMVAGDGILMAVLDGVPPEGAKRLKVTGVDDRSGAWEIGGQIYLRTPHSLLSPAWSASTASGDGTTVYVLPDTPVLLLSDQGVMVRARISKPIDFAAGDALNEH